MTSTRGGRTGRRPGGDSGTREAIRAAATRQFATQGFDRTSLRSVATEAGVDPGLVAYFHGTKSRLFLDVIALPVDPDVAVPRVLAGPTSGTGERLAGLVLRVLEDPSSQQQMLGMVRAACSEPEAARLLRERLTHDLLSPIAEAAGGPNAAYRAGLAMSQIVGIAMARYIIGLEPLASAPPDAVVASLAPTLQRYLVDVT